MEEKIMKIWIRKKKRENQYVKASSLGKSIKLINI